MERFDRSDDIPSGYHRQLDICGNLLVDPKFLRFIEQARTLPCRHRYLAFSAGDDLLAFFPGMLLDVGYDDFCPQSAARGIALLRGLKQDLLRYRTLEFGSPVLTGPAHFIAEGVGDECLPRMLAELVDTEKRDGCRVILFRDFQGPRTRLEEGLLEQGFVLLPNLPTTRLRIDFENFGDYLKRFSAAGRRNIRRKRKQARQKGVRKVVTGSLLEEPETYRRLYEQVRRRADLPGRERLGTEYFLSGAENLPENSKLIHYYRNGELIAFVSLVHTAEKLYSLYIGMDYSRSREAAIYFQAYYDQIEYALEQGIREIDAGMTTYLSKTKLGFEIVPQRMYLWTDSALLRRRMVSFFTALPTVV